MLRPLLKRIHYPLYRARLRMDWWLHDRFDKPADGPLPPARLRFRVGEDNDPATFTAVGRTTAENLKAALSRLDFRLQPGMTALDFGCGCGRTLMFLAKDHPEVRWHGSDIDAQSIEWCKRNVNGAEFAANEPVPPLDYAEGQFDLIYAVSVFTHLDADYQRVWARELARVLKPGGLLLASFHSRSVWEPLEAARAVERYGFAFRTSDKLKGIMPNWYHTAFRDQASVEKLFSEYFTGLKYLEGALGAQDLAAAFKPRS